MQSYTELLPPTGVTHALAVPFMSATANNLVVVRTSLLQIFSLLNVAPQSNGVPTEDKLSQPDQLENIKLVLEREYSLHGTVTDLSRVKILDTKTGGEAILLAFRNAKLSLIEWDDECYGISTISIHYYERDDLNRSPWVPDLTSCGSILSVDPSSRCAVYNFGIRNLAILPFHQPGDDLVMDDYDSEIEKGSPRNEHGQVSESGTAKNGSAYQTPYASSFVLPLTMLDPSLLHPIDLVFLYEYREPTFGILYSQIATSHSLLHERRDVVFYTVFTLDLEQRASTTLLSVSKLPSDLFRVVALPPPVGGALLIGSNELVHVDQAGKTNAVGVNEFSKQASSFSMTDQSSLALRLEGCVVERVDAESGDLVLVLSTGNIVLVKFKLDGRSVSGISVYRLPAHTGGNIMGSAASCSAFLGNGRIFFGSEDADSVLTEWFRSTCSTKNSRLHSRHGADDPVDASEEDLSEEDIYEDDLYSTGPEGSLQARSSSTEGSASGIYNSRMHDRLCNIGPLRDVTLGRSHAALESKDHNVDDHSADLELVAAQCSDGSGSLVVLKREIDPRVVISTKIDYAESIWSVSVSSTTGRRENKETRRYVITSKSKYTDKEESEVFTVDGTGLKPFKAHEFNPNADFAIDIGTLANGTRVVQVLKNEVRSYDINLALAQIYPVWDEDTSDERMAISACFTDPYLTILRDDFSLLLLQADDSGDVDEIALSEEVTNKKWLSSCLYCDRTGIFSFSSSATATEKEHSRNDILLFLLSSDSKLFMLRLPDQRLLSVAEGVDCLPPVLSEEPPKRSTARETLTEVVVANLGDSWCNQPYLILRTENDDLAIYKPFRVSTEAHSLRFLRETNHFLAKLPTNVSNQPEEGQQRSRPLRILPDVGGFSVVFMPGVSASFIFKTSTSPPHVIRLRERFVRGLSSFDYISSGCEKGFIYVDSKNVVRICQLPVETRFDYSWTLRKVPIGEQVDCLAYSSSSETYVLGTSYKADFKLPGDDELHPEWRDEVMSFFPRVERGSIKIVSPRTWSVIDSYPLGPTEQVMTMKNINLEISERTHERRDTIVVGTAFTLGEDIPARGCIYVFEVIKVVPDPDRPEMDRKLKLIGKETVKGAVTALSGIGGQGFLIIAQGQKCMVRGLKEDGSLLPVAFMDMQCYVSVVKELKGTGMCILGDAMKGLWFAGYSEEPYKMTLFGKDPEYLEVVTADFLPDGKKLYILVADSDCNLHVLQYDPEDPRSSNGDRLLDRSKFHTGNFASTLTLLPRTVVSSELLMCEPDEMDIDGNMPQYQVLITSQNGSMAIVTSVPEESYRRLSALQSQLTNTLEHPCGLNPRAFRSVESDVSAGRGMLDGNILYRWLDLGTQRKTEIAGRVGASEWEIRADLEAISGAGLGYL